MADTTIKFLSYTGLQQYDGLIKGYVDAAVDAVGAETAKAFKAVALEGNVLHFYLEDPKTDESVAKYSVTLPFADYQVLVKAAVEGNLAAFDANGQVMDSGIKMADVATKAEVEAVADDLAELVAKVGEIPVGEDGNAIAVTVVEYVNKKTEGIATDAALGELQAAVDAIEADYLKAEDKTELEGKIALKADQTALQGEIDRATGIEAGLRTDVDKVAADLAQEILDARAAEKANADAIAVLNGDGEGSVSKQVADAVAGIVNGAPEAYNTLKEISDWIEAHPNGVAELNTAIKANADAIDALETLVGELPEGETDVVAYIQKLVKAEEDRAKLAEQGLDTRLQAVEAKFEGDASVEAQIEAALKDAKDYTDVEVKELAEGAVAANAEEIAKINDAETGILKQAKDYADAEVAKDRERLVALEEASATHATQEALAKEVQDRKDADAAIEAKIGTVTEGKTVVQMIADAQAEATYDDEEVRGLISDNADAIAALEGTHNTDKAALEAADEAMAEDITALQEALALIEEIPAADINALFGITE